jgi:hypothetical protein
MEFVIAKQQRDERHDRDLSHAWHVAAFSRQDKLPSLMSLLQARRQSSETEQRAPVQTIAQQRTMLRLISDTWGLHLRPATVKSALRPEAAV